MYQHPMNTPIDEQKKLLLGNDLSQSKRSILLEYRELARRKSLSEEEADRIQEILEYVEEDEELIQRIELVDALEVTILEGEPILSENESLRIHLNEHLGVLAQDRLMNGQSEIHIRRDQEPSTEILMLCPDGSGYIKFPLNSGDVVSLEDLKNKISAQCNTAVQNYEQLLFFREALH